MKTLIVLTVCVASISFADDFKTADGKEYKGVTVTRVEPDGIVVKMKSGISKLYFVELPKEVQERFHYDPQQGTAYSAEQAANYATYQKQQEEARRQREDEDAQKKAIFLQQQAINNAGLQQQEEALRPTREANQPTSTHRRKTTVLHPLPVTRSQPPPQSEPNDKKQSKKPKHQ